MDGTHERLPAGPAENWSRSDKIRAGAVSGPWRSAPRVGPVQVIEPPRPKHPTAAKRRGDPPLAWISTDGAVNRPLRTIDLLLPEPELARPIPPMRARRSAAVAALLIGTLIAGAIIGLAVVLRTDFPAIPAAEPAVASVVPAATAHSATRAVDSAATAPAAGPAQPTTALAPAMTAMRPAAPAAAPAATGAAAGVGPVHVRIGQGLAEDRQHGIIAALRSAGYQSVEVDPLPFRIAEPRVGYYRGADRAAAEALARLVAPLIPQEAGPVAIRDYGQLLPGTEPGRLDLWIAG